MCLTVIINISDSNTTVWKELNTSVTFVTEKMSLRYGTEVNGKLNDHIDSKIRVKLSL